MSHCLRLILSLVGICLAVQETAAQVDRRLGALGDLPPHLQFREGELNFVIDYAAAEHIIVPLYVVNAGDKPARHGADALILRETLGEDGIWRRCDVYRPPFCRVGMDEIVTIPPGAFFKTVCRLDSASGERRKVRYREYPLSPQPTPISNEGEGIVHPEDTRWSRLDPLATSSDSFEELAFVAAEEPGFDYGVDARGIAIRRLSMLFDEPRRVPALQEVVRRAPTQGNVEAYQSALGALAMVTPPLWTREQFWKFATNELFSRDDPFAGAAYAVLLHAPFFAEKRRQLLEQILANPRHPLLKQALADYPRISGDRATRALVQRISKSPKYEDDFKRFARALNEPFVRKPVVIIRAVPTSPDALGGHALAITLINISRKAVAFRIPDPHRHVTITATFGDNQKLPARKRAVPPARIGKPVELQWLEDFTLPAVQWWEHVDVTQMPANHPVLLAIGVRPPGWSDDPPIPQCSIEIAPAAVDAARMLQRHYARANQRVTARPHPATLP